MESSKWPNLFVLISMITCTALCISCNKENGMEKHNEGIYRVVLEASGEDYSAEANIYNLNDVSLFDETKGENLCNHSVVEYFTGIKKYSTMGKVKSFSAMGMIISKKPAILSMTVFKDGISIYSKSVSIVPEGDGMRNVTKDLVFINIE